MPPPCEGGSINLFDEIRGYGNFHPAVEHVFKKQTPDIQQSIIASFHEAVKLGLVVPHAGKGNNVITPDSNLVRRETYTDNECLFEITTSQPKVMRVFIAQDKGELYVLNIKSKEEMQDGGVKQNKALRDAEKRFKNMKNNS